MTEKKPHWTFSEYHNLLNSNEDEIAPADQAFPYIYYFTVTVHTGAASVWLSCLAALKICKL